MDDLLVNGLPQPTPSAMRMVITGLDEGTTAMISDDTQTIPANSIDNGSMALDLPEMFRIAEATLVIDHPDGSRTTITSADEFVDGDVRLAIDLVVDVGDDVATATVTVSGDGFVPGTAIDLSLHSTPRQLATVAADASGAFESTVTLPADVEPGEHRVLASGETPTGPISGESHFSIGAAGVVERVGDPTPADILAAAAATDAATEPPAGTDGLAEPLSAAGNAPIDDRSGLPVYTPTAEPEQTVETAVEAFALLSLLGAGTSLAAAGMAGGGMAQGSRRGTGGGSGGVARRGGSSGSASGGDDRGQGEIASGEAAEFGDALDGVAWGDASITWRWPLANALDRVGRWAPERVHPVSPLAGRVLADGSTMRAVLGSGSMLLPVAAAILAVMAALDTGGLPVAPSLGLMLALLVIGVVDASAGFVAAAVFTAVVVASGGITSADSVRGLLGVVSLWFAISLIAGATRPFRRSPAQDWADRWDGVGDVVLGSLLAGWTAQSVTGSLPGLSGLDMPIADHANLVALTAIGALAGRYLFERLAVRGYPNRLAAVTFEPPGDPSMRQQVWSITVKALMFAFIVAPYIGLRWELALAAALSVIPSYLGLVGDRFPSSSRLYMLLPRGIPSTLVGVTIGAVVGGLLTARIDDPQRLFAISFVVLALPGFVLELLGLVGREGADPEGWTRRVAGSWVAGVALAMVLGYLGESPWLPLLLVAPLLVWWLVVSLRADGTVGEVDAVDVPRNAVGESINWAAFDDSEYLPVRFSFPPPVVSVAHSDVPVD